MRSLDAQGRLQSPRRVIAIPRETEIDQMIAEMDTSRTHVERLMIQLIEDAQCYASGDPEHRYCLQDPHRADEVEMELYGMSKHDWDPTLRF